MTKTIAILGARTITGSVIADELAGVGYVLVLMDKQLEFIESLQQTLMSRYPLAVVDVATCAYESAWEADVIILALPDSVQIEQVQVIREVVTRKRVIRIADGMATDCRVEQLRQILPYTSIVNASLADFRQDVTALLAC